MVDVHAQYYVPSQYGDIITVETRISAFGRTSFSVHHKLYKGDVLAVEIFRSEPGWPAFLTNRCASKHNPSPKRSRGSSVGSAIPANMPVQVA